MSNKLKKCPRCGKINPIAANYCRHCGELFSEESKEGQYLAPIIKDFLVIEEIYYIGSTINIMWEVSNATELYFNGLSVINRDSSEFVVKGDCVIELTAKNEFAQVTKKVKITPAPLPRILNFKASRQRIIEGESIKLTWDVKNAVKTVLHSTVNNDVDLTKRIKYEATPVKGEILTLECFAKDKNISVKQDLAILVLRTVVINSFEATSYSIVESDVTTLKWSVENANSIILSPLGQDVSDLSEFTVNPKHSSKYLLIAKNDISSRTAQLSIEVKTLPKINYIAPNIGTLLKIPTIKLDLSSFTDNLVEIDIDKWISQPLSKHRPFWTILLPLKRFKHKIQNTLTAKLRHPHFESERCMILLKTMMCIVIITLCSSNVFVLCTCSILWIKITSFFAICLCILYGISIFHMFKKETNYQEDPILKLVSSLFLILSSVPLELFTVCGGDFSLLSQMGISIWGRERILLPITILSFLILIQYFLIKFISITKKDTNNYYQLKKSIYG